MKIIKKNSLPILLFVAFIAVSGIMGKAFADDPPEAAEGEDGCPACNPDEKLADPITEDPAYQAYAAEVRRTESGGRYGVENNFGYMGAYQMGKAALIDAGFVVADGNNGNKSTYTWTAKAQALGVNSRESFLANAAAQDAAFAAYNEKQLSYLKGKGAFAYLCTEVTDGTRTGRVNTLGLLKGAHLVGAGGVTSALKSGNHNLADAYGTTAAKYMLDGTAISNGCIPTTGDSHCSPGAGIDGESSQYDEVPFDMHSDM